MRRKIGWVTLKIVIRLTPRNGTTPRKISDMRLLMRKAMMMENSSISGVLTASLISIWKAI